MIEELKAFVAQKKYVLAFTAILLAALYMRMRMFVGPMEFDEIWTIGHYADRSVLDILTDLATPNNHPLNTIFVKLWWNLFELRQLTRLHSLIFGMLSVVLTGVLARGIFHSRAAALFSMLFLAFDAAAVCYSDLARGYMTQLFFLLLFSCGVVWSGRLRRFLPWKEYLPEAAIVVGAAGAALAVPTAPIFLAAVVIAARIYHRKRPTPAMYVAMGIAGALVVTYLGVNQEGLREAQSKFGTRFTEPNELFGFVLMLLEDFFALGVVPFLLVTVAVDKRRAMLLGFCAMLIAGSAAFTSAGPSRVYLPLCVIVALGCGRGAQALMTVALCRNNRRLVWTLLVTAALLAWFGGYQLSGAWHITDYWSWFDAGREMPKDRLVVYPATAGLPLRENNGAKEVAKDQLPRLLYDVPGERRVVCFGVKEGEINGMNADGGEESRKTGTGGTPAAAKGFPAVEYRLRPAETPAPGEAFVAVLNPALDLNKLKSFKNAGCDMLWLNPHFPTPQLVFGKAPADPAVWAKVRKNCVFVYTFATPEAKRKTP